jgi:hypothetical protein
LLVVGHPWRQRGDTGMPFGTRSNSSWTDVRSRGLGASVVAVVVPHD